MRSGGLLFLALISFAMPASAGVSASNMPLRNAEAVRRLSHNKGVTLQWLDWNTRGTVVVRREGDYWTLRGAQAEAGGKGRLFLDGGITQMGPDYFIFDGRIAITDTPDPGRHCDKTKTWRFAVTQNRPYYRLREFEWCDGLTDYIDIYF